MLLPLMLCAALVMGTMTSAAATSGPREQCYNADDLKSLNKTKVAGGEGTLYGLFSSTRDEAGADQAIKEIGIMRLDPGDSIGLHTHGVNEDTYIILYGTGLFTDGVTETQVSAGDVTLARPGQGHGLTNNSDDVLVFLDVIAQNNNAPMHLGWNDGETCQCFRHKTGMHQWNRQDVAGGKGTLYGSFAFDRNEATDWMAIKEIGWMTLQPGDSIGLHKHTVNEDAYIIISGTGTFSDGVKETQVTTGSITIARAGQSHALANTGTEPLVFLDIIAQNDPLNITEEIRAAAAAAQALLDAQKNQTTDK